MGVQPLKKFLPIYVLAQALASKVGQLALGGEVIDHHDIIEIGGIEAGDKTASNKAGGSGNNNHKAEDLTQK
ncbi:hypothetical protein GCM10011378_36130 [Hymenobacter glacieicola]|uniref:Uncharacterized protein n=1 Tax=Hymenobacter glacieicola TaxID=1562124 RepID=A0ABQ1X2K5_9BACT|nr:hypothetical protein GCM10011378_36130 [Hymenobacter glacieicola]